MTIDQRVAFDKARKQNRSRLLMTPRIARAPSRAGSNLTGRWLYVAVKAPASVTQIRAAWEALSVVGSFREWERETSRGSLSGYTISVRRQGISAIIQEAQFTSPPRRHSHGGHAHVIGREPRRLQDFVSHKLKEAGVRVNAVNSRENSPHILLVNAELSRPEFYLEVTSVIQDTQAEAGKRLAGAYYSFVDRDGDQIMEVGTVWPFARILGWVRPQLLAEDTAPSASRPENRGLNKLWVLAVMISIAVTITMTLVVATDYRQRRRERRDQVA